MKNLAELSRGPLHKSFHKNILETEGIQRKTGALIKKAEGLIAAHEAQVAVAREARVSVPLSGAAVPSPVAVPAAPTRLSVQGNGGMSPSLGTDARAPGIVEFDISRAAARSVAGPARVPAGMLPLGWGASPYDAGAVYGVPSSDPMSRPSIYPTGPSAPSRGGAPVSAYPTGVQGHSPFRSALEASPMGSSPVGAVARVASSPNRLTAHPSSPSVFLPGQSSPAIAGLPYASPPGHRPGQRLGDRRVDSPQVVALNAYLQRTGQAAHVSSPPVPGGLSGASRVFFFR